MALSGDDTFRRFDKTPAVQRITDDRRQIDVTSLYQSRACEDAPKADDCL